MFTGLVQATGSVLDVMRSGSDATVRIESHGLDVSTILRGDSIAVNGACLTVMAMQTTTFDMHLSAETLSRTTLGALQCGDEVNLETALTPMSKLGGHLVSGHVDGVGEVAACEQAGASARLAIDAPRRLAKYIAEKGSICVDGVSLTVNVVEGARFTVNVIPHTQQVTTFRHYLPGTRVNLEVDLVARYLERLLLGDGAADKGRTGITREFLAKHGFLKDDRDASAG